MSKVFITSIMALALVGCTPDRGKRIAVAECKISALEESGFSYRRAMSDRYQVEFSPSGRSSDEKNLTGLDVAYRDYLAECMERKGYQFADAPQLDEDSVCWAQDSKNEFNTQSRVLEPDCYRRIW